ncbi:MAG TPA: hypothetical protein PLA43_01415 [Bryobacteraceae bacterium]|nr:hypothetical protein [Bryobacteraceae bacterium]HOQ44269.1 hypothetical protein [Bryobacteraceae bacterium]HPQ16279.1 hypothetical protein [Bryobacteraceae bacterium]HPU70587.1 hypothetical protein [Bryobacteraceae bacterium]
MFSSRFEPAQAVGCAYEQLRPQQAAALAGLFAAFEIYEPSTAPLRRIEAIGKTPEECIRELAARGLDPRRYEIRRLKPPF